MIITIVKKGSRIGPIVWLFIILFTLEASAVTCDLSNDYSCCLAKYDDATCACCVIASPGVYNLTSYFSSNCPKDWQTSCEKSIAILIDSNDVFLDGNGISIDSGSGYNTTECRAGIVAGTAKGSYPFSNNTVTNVDIKNWNYGIVYWKQRLGRITNSNITGNQYGIFLTGSPDQTETLENGNLIDFNNINNNENGIAFFWAPNNTIDSNIITSNEHGIYFESPTPKSQFNLFTNNTFHYNTIDVYFHASEQQENTWDGNYWFGSCSEEPYCNCNTILGVCTNPCIISPNNIDYALCSEYFEISVRGNITNWQIPVGDNTIENAINISVITNADNWSVSAHDEMDKDNKPSESEGKLTAYNIITKSYGQTWLQNPIQVKALDQELYPYQYLNTSPIIVNCQNGPCEDDKYQDIGIRQQVGYGDPSLPPDSIYRIVIEFVVGEY
jgi:hypothetical protein